MTNEFQIALVVLALLNVKHFVCDFPLQTSYQFLNKGKYGHPGGLLHAGIHLLGTVPALIFAEASASIAAGILAAEFVVHYHIDWAKQRIQTKLALDSSSGGFFTLLGADQLLHQLTYVSIVAALVSAL